MRQVVLDTETTGLDIANDHRIIEIAGVELVIRKLTKNSYQVYLNPERTVGQSFKIHGLSDDFLSDKPSFKDIFGLQPYFFARLISSTFLGVPLGFDLSNLIFIIVLGKITFDKIFAYSLIE